MILSVTSVCSIAESYDSLDISDGIFQFLDYFNFIEDSKETSKKLEINNEKNKEKSLFSQNNIMSSNFSIYFSKGEVFLFFFFLN
jgi:hypothetical protein